MQMPNDPLLSMQPLIPQSIWFHRAYTGVLGSSRGKERRPYSPRVKTVAPHHRVTTRSLCVLAGESSLQVRLALLGASFNETGGFVGGKKLRAP